MRRSQLLKHLRAHVCLRSGRTQPLLVGESVAEQAVVRPSPFRDHGPIGTEDLQGPGNRLHEVAPGQTGSRLATYHTSIDLTGFRGRGARTQLARLVSCLATGLEMTRKRAPGRALRIAFLAGRRTQSATSNRAPPDVATRLLVTAAAMRLRRRRGSLPPRRSGRPWRRGAAFHR